MVFHLDPKHTVRYIDLAEDLTLSIIYVNIH